MWQHFEALSGQGACSGLSPLREEGYTLSQFAFLSLSYQESHTKETECIISCFLKGNCVSQACKTHSTSVIKMHQRKWLTRSSGLAQLQKVIRGLNDSRFLFTGEQKLWDTIQGFLSFKLLRISDCNTPSLLQPPQCRKMLYSHVTVQLRVTNSATTSCSTCVKQSHFRIILMFI